jgi:hypothetical protein
MSLKELRTGQLLTTFGPGALVDFPDEALIIAGTQDWVYSGTMPVIHEARLEAKLRLRLQKSYVELRLPPTKEELYGISKTFVRAYAFPQWVQVQEKETAPGSPRYIRRRLVHRDSLTPDGKYMNDAGKKIDVLPIRFVRACPSGHIGDINWPNVVHGGATTHRKLWIEERGTSGELSGIHIVCECGLEKSLSLIFKSGNEDLGYCDGSRPWLGQYAKEPCTHRNRALIRSASNAYFPQLMSVISIPDLVTPLEDAINSQWSILQAVDDMTRLEAFCSIPQVQSTLSAFPRESVLQAILRKKNGEDILGEMNVKEVEFLALSSAPQEMPSEIPAGDFFARELQQKTYSGFDSRRYFEKIVAVHALREVIALLGFTRLEPLSKNVDGEYDPSVDLGVALAPIGLDVNWLPAIENHGEGIFIQFRQTEVESWLARPAVIQYGEKLREAFDSWKIDHKGSGLEFPGIEYYMAHSLCHIILSAFTLECGYPASSLKERIYTCENGLGFLIYTASSDAAGTLGGLVQAGRSLTRLMASALENAKLCSNDPVCSAHEPDDHDNRYLSGASCHSCLYIPETSCEQWNELLDRRLVVETLDRKGIAFFS